MCVCLCLCLCVRARAWVSVRMCVCARARVRFSRGLNADHARTRASVCLCVCERFSRGLCIDLTRLQALLECRLQLRPVPLGCVCVGVGVGVCDLRPCLTSPPQPNATATATFFRACFLFFSCCSLRRTFHSSLVAVASEWKSQFSQSATGTSHTCTPCAWACVRV